MVQTFKSDVTFEPMDPCHGHVGTFMKDGRGVILKEAIKREQEAYHKLQQDALLPFVPGYLGVARGVGEGKDYLALRDLAVGLSEPLLMDCKMGLRTFLESDCANLIPREDLYKKMVKISPDLPTDEENAAAAVSKLRYMVVRENLSSSASLGFRIDGIGGGVEREATNGLQQVKTRAEVLHMMNAYLTKAVGDGDDMRQKVVTSVVAQLDELHTLLPESKFFQAHEMVGSSILFVVDKLGQTVLKIIDFAKCQELPEGVVTTHDQAWHNGNHEDGWLIGLRNLRDLWASLAPAPQGQSPASTDATEATETSATESSGEAIKA